MAGGTWGNRGATGEGDTRQGGPGYRARTRARAREGGWRPVEVKKTVGNNKSVNTNSCPLIK